MLTKRNVILAVVVLLCVVFLAIPAYSQYQTKVYFDNGGDRLNIATGGELLIASGATVTIHDATYLAANASMAVSAPTAQATAVPALSVDSLGVSNLFEVRDAATPVWAINNGGAVVQGGAGSYAGVQTYNSNVIVNAPTAIATAIPAFSVDSLGVSNLFEVRDAATPVLQVNNGGAMVATGSLDVGGTLNYGANNLYVMGYASSGASVVCATQTVTDTLTVATGLTTPLFCWANIAGTVSGDARTAACAVSSTNAVITVRNSALTPVANATGVATYYCAIGTK
jgi:hypothetical protein